MSNDVLDLMFLIPDIQSLKLSDMDNFFEINIKATTGYREIYHSSKT